MASKHNHSSESAPQNQSSLEQLMSDHPWLKSYPQGVPYQIDTELFSSINELLEISCAKYRSLKSFECMGKAITYHDLDHLSGQFASFLQHELKLKKGERIALMMPNVLQYPIALFGALRAGLIVVNTNPLYTARELEHQLKDSGAQTIVILANFAHILDEVVKHTQVQNIVVTELGDMLGLVKGFIVNKVVKHVKKMVPAYRLDGHYTFEQALHYGSFKPYQEVPVSLEDLAFLQYTGGTTGVSKGAMLTHGNIVANMLQIKAWMKPLLTESEEIVLTPLPLYHIFSLTVNCLLFASHGCKNILIPNPRDIAAFIKEMKKSQFTVMTGVNTLFNALMNHPDFAKLDFKKVKVSVAGGMALQKAVALRWKEMTQSLIIEGYGLTETSPVASANPIDGNDKVGTIGIPLPNTRMKLRKEDGSEAGPGESGEICIYGPQVMKGYWQRPDETAKVMTPDGYFKTGDVGILDEDGYFKIIDRIKDMILVSGFNVYPNEIEDVVAAHPGVLEVAAIGVADEKSGEVVKIVVVKKNEEVTAEDIIAHCRENLTNYKVPKYVEFRSELPKTNVGKILRRALRDQGPTAKTA